MQKRAYKSSISNLIAGGYTNGTIGSYGFRATPDIATLGDNFTELNIYVSGNLVPNDGGTSLASPLFAAMTALINQERILLNQGTSDPIGQVAPYLYNNQSTLVQHAALNLITPPHQLFPGATKSTLAGAPPSSFTIFTEGFDVTFNWDSSLTINENQFWNDVVGLGSPNVPNYVATMARC